MNGLTNRMRRLREHPVLAEMVREVSLEPRQMILPLFTVPGTGVRKPVPSLHGVDHISPDRLHEAVDTALGAGIRSFLLFGLPSRKDPRGTSAWAEDQPVQQGLRLLKEKYGREIHLTTDVCMCEYTDHGHCGLLKEDGAVDNDPTVLELGRIALSHARAGADMVAPSAMMDGQVAAIRRALDNGGIPLPAGDELQLQVLVGLLRSLPGRGRQRPSFGDRRSYQMASTNWKEALRESLLDEEEGADILMVKPSLLYMDILSRLRESTLLPLACYLVSGEYMMLRHAAAAGSLDGPRGLLEAHLALRRAGADILITYAAVEVARMVTGR
jgi:Delta-aminolevulinic acid dehydratase